jgi:hypothetical protein
MSGVLVVMCDPWQIDDLPVSYAAFGDDVVGERPHVIGASFQHRHLHATLMVKVNVQRSLREIVMIVEVARQPLWQVALMVVVDIDEGGDALSWSAGLR